MLLIKIGLSLGMIILDVDVMCFIMFIDVLYDVCGFCCMCVVWWFVCMVLVFFLFGLVNVCVVWLLFWLWWLNLVDYVVF